MSVAVAKADREVSKRPVELRSGFLARQDTGWLSVSSLGAVSAESCGRDSFAESAGFGQLRFGSPAKADDHQTERL
jgi:hypothetical protein